MELGDEKRSALSVSDKDVRSVDRKPGPLVALLGCDTGTTAEDFCYLVRTLQGRGAAVVIGTIATVYGQHAAAVARLLADRLYGSGRNGSECLGEIMRDVKREGLRQDLLMALCLVAFGDADWLLLRGRRNQ